jgi:hypothetical protein
MGLLDKLRGKKDDGDKPKTGKLAVKEGSDVLVDPAGTGDYLPKEGAGGVAAEDDLEMGKSGGVDESGQDAGGGDAGSRG